MSGLLLLAACAAPPGPPEIPFRDSPAGPQRPFAPGAVLHGDRQGRVLDRLVPDESFFVLALDNALVDYERGQRFGFMAAAEAGFNAVSPWREQPLEAVLEAAIGSRLQAILPPSLAGGLEGEAAEAVLDPSEMRLVRLAPFRRDAPRARLGGGDALGALEQAVRQAMAEKRPVWAELQVFAAPAQGLRQPTPEEARALAWGAVIQGAAGLVWFAEDSYAARSAGALGIAPLPPLDYGVLLMDGGGLPVRPSPSEISRARALWQTAARINGEIDRLLPWLLQPPAPLNYAVSLRAATGGEADEEVPLRSRLLFYDNAYVLIAVNIGAARQEVRFSFAKVLRRAERLFVDTGDAAPRLSSGGAMLEDTFDPLQVKIYRLQP